MTTADFIIALFYRIDNQMTLRSMNIIISD